MDEWIDKWMDKWIDDEWINGYMMNAQMDRYTVQLVRYM